jgi:hypothetical protein
MWDYETRKLADWTIRIRRELLDGKEQKKATLEALGLLRGQLEQVNRRVPGAARRHLHTVTLWMSPPYPNTIPRAEYHPGAEWLRQNQRNPEMEKGIEFTNIAIFPKECRRMPMMALHELAHAYHHQVLGYDNPEIQNAYRQAVASKTYESVQRQGRGLERAYALNNAMEYFAETSEAFFGTNDFYPFTRSDLRKHDPEMEKLLKRLWDRGK